MPVWICGRGRESGPDLRLETAGLSPPSRDTCTQASRCPDWIVVFPGRDWTVVSPGPDWIVVSPGPDWTVVSPGPDWTVVSPGRDWTVRMAPAGHRAPAGVAGAGVPA
jgi:hypothetical protein